MTTDYPNDADGDALRRLVAGGGDMSKPIDIDFFIAASDEATATEVADKATELGYRTEVCFDDDVGSGDSWTCECSKAMIPTYQAVIAAQAELDAIARPLGAYADGWGTLGDGEQYTMTGLESEPVAPKPARRRFQFSLRTLLVIVTAVAVIMAVFVAPTRTQRIVQDIQKMNGLYSLKKTGPIWFRELFGRTVPDPLDSTGTTTIGPFDGLKGVTFGSFAGSLSPPCGLRDEWLDNLAGQTSLQGLYLNGAPITDDGIFRLRDLPHLRHLELANVPIGDWGLAHISAFTNLETLRLSNSRISGRTIFALRMLPHLKELWLDYTDVDDAAIPDLKELRSLEILRLEETSLTWTGANELRSALPQCYIAYRPRESRPNR